MAYDNDRQEHDAECPDLLMPDRLKRAVHDEIARR